MTPYISIIIPVFGRVDLFIETFQSILSQSMPSFECIIVDDGSKPEDWDKIRDICSGYRNILAYKRPNNFKKGAPSCRNYGALKAKGNYLFFLDSDDIIGENFVKLRIESLIQHFNYDLWIYPVQVFHTTPGDSKILWNLIHNETNDLDRFLNTDNPWHTSSTIWKKSFFNKIGGFDADLLSWQDWDIHIRAILENAKIKKINRKPDVYYRQHEQTSISKEKQHITIFENRLSLFLKILSYIRSKGQLTNKRKYLLAKLIINLAIAYHSLVANAKETMFSQIKKNKLLRPMDIQIWKLRMKIKNSLINKTIDKYIYFMNKDHFLDTKTSYLNTKID